MKASSYVTIRKESSGKVVIKKSSFLSFAIPIENLEEFENKIRDFKKQYYDARHVCYAFVLSPEGDVSRASDGGEPSGTAGRPILGVIHSNGLTNVAVVVVRYFGGIKLGTSGLIAAYKEAAEQALSQAERMECEVEETFHLSFEYSHVNDVMRLLKFYHAKVLSNQMDLICSLSFSVGVNLSEAITQQLSKIESVKFL
jgi:uncharacterized YigZ family protein